MTDITKQIMRVANVALDGSRYNPRFVWKDDRCVYATNGVVMVCVRAERVDMSKVPESLQLNHPRTRKLSDYLDAPSACDDSKYAIAPKQLRAALAVFDAVGECPMIVPKGYGYMLSSCSVEAVIMGVRM